MKVHQWFIIADIQIFQEGKILVEVMMSWLSSMPMPSEGSDATWFCLFLCVHFNLRISLYSSISGFLLLLWFSFFFLHLSCSSCVSIVDQCLIVMLLSHVSFFPWLLYDNLKLLWRFIHYKMISYCVEWKYACCHFK